MREVLDVFVPGRARPAGSKVSGVATRKNAAGEREAIRRADGTYVTFTKDSSGPAGEEWRGDVREVVMRTYEGPKLRACRLVMVFARSRPKGHYRSGRHAHELRPGAPRVPTTRPDALKLARAVEDALTGVLYADDAAVVELAAAKVYGDPGVQISVWRVEPSTIHTFGCVRCGRDDLAATDFYRRRGSPRAGGRPPNWIRDSWCKSCRAAHQRRIREERKRDAARLERRRRLQRERVAERRRTEPGYAERKRRQNREWWARLSPERRLELLQDKRINNRLARERAGLPINTRPPAPAQGGYSPSRNGSRLPPEPLLEVIPPDWQGTNDSQARALYRLRHGQLAKVSLAVADDLLCSLGKPWLLRTLYEAALRHKDGDRLVAFLAVAGALLLVLLLLLQENGCGVV